MHCIDALYWCIVLMHCIDAAVRAYTALCLTVFVTRKAICAPIGSRGNFSKQRRKPMFWHAVSYWWNAVFNFPCLINSAQLKTHAELLLFGACRTYAHTSTPALKMQSKACFQSCSTHSKHDWLKTHAFNYDPDTQIMTGWKTACLQDEATACMSPVRFAVCLCVCACCTAECGALMASGYHEGDRAWLAVGWGGKLYVTLDGTQPVHHLLCWHQAGLALHWCMQGVALQKVMMIGKTYKKSWDVSLMQQACLWLVYLDCIHTEHSIKQSSKCRNCLKEFHGLPP